MENILAKVFELEGLVDYQDGSIVSRQLIKKSTGSITLFAFDKDQALSEHTAPFDAFIYLLDGQAEITIAGDVFNINKNQMIIMPADKPHSVKAKEKFKMLLVMIRS